MVLLDHNVLMHEIGKYKAHPDFMLNYLDKICRVYSRAASFHLKKRLLDAEYLNLINERGEYKHFIKMLVSRKMYDALTSEQLKELVSDSFRGSLVEKFVLVDEFTIYQGNQKTHWPDGIEHNVLFVLGYSEVPDAFNLERIQVPMPPAQ